MDDHARQASAQAGKQAGQEVATDDVEWTYTVAMVEGIGLGETVSSALYRRNGDTEPANALSCAREQRGEMAACSGQHQDHNEQHDPTRTASTVNPTARGRQPTHVHEGDQRRDEVHGQLVALLQRSQHSGLHRPANHQTIAVRQSSSGGTRPKGKACTADAPANGGIAVQQQAQHALEERRERAHSLLTRTQSHNEAK